LTEETCVLDPVEFIPERVELALDQLGLEIRAEGVDWGESQITPQMVRQAEGEVSSDGHREGVQIRIPIRVKEEGAVSLAEAAHKLQQKCGTLQEFGGWIRRDFDEAGGFAGSVGYKILRHTLSISGLDGWLFAHNRDAPDVVITATRWPIGYPTEEVEEGPFTNAAGERHLIFTEDASQGSAPGLWRGRIKNEGVEDLRGLILSRECETAPSDLEDPTAQPHYLAKNLTPLGGAEVKTVSGIELVQAELVGGQLAILGSEIAGEGHVTHQGPRAVWMRVYVPSETTDGVRLQLLVRALGAARWDESLPIVTIPIVGGWVPVCLGVARPQAALLGDERWEWKLTAWAPAGSGTLRIRDVYPLATEQYVLLRQPEEHQIAEGFATKPPGTVVSGSGGKEWKSPSSATISDDSRATCTLGPGGEFGAYLEAKNLGIKLPPGAIPTGVEFSFELSATVAAVANSANVYILKAGALQKAVNRATADKWPTTDSVFVFGGASDLWGVTLTAADVEDPGFGVALKPFAAYVGTVDLGVDAVNATVYYAQEADGEDRVCFSSRSVEIRSDGIIRQHPTDDVWGYLTPDGFPPIAPQGGLEGRAVRTVVIPSAGDLATLPDGSTPLLRATTYRRAGHLFAQEQAI
jgi:hypothetical protein